MASTVLKRNNTTPTGTKKYTFSAWVKRSGISSRQQFFRVINPSDTAHYTFIEFQADDKIGTNDYNGTNSFSVVTNRLFRDTSAWYHIVLAVDTTQSTAADRVTLWVNGEEQTSFSSSSYGAQDAVIIATKSGKTVHVGAGEDTRYLDGSMAHVHFIDGTAYAASDFGETDSTTGIWKPKTAPSVTYGTNGFFLKFANSGSMGTDSSGNSNTFTISGNLTQTQDTPSNVFCCLNPLKKHSGQTLSFLNLRNVGAGSANIVGSTLSPSQGKWYFEFKLISAEAYAVFFYPQNLYQVGDSFFSSNYTTGFYSTAPSLYRNGSNTGSLGGGVANDDIISVAMDLDSNNIYFAKNGNWNDGLGGGFDQSDFSNATGHTLTRNSSFDEIGIATLNGGSGSSYTLDWNFGNGYFGTTAVSSSNADGAGYGLFEYAPPSGYYSLCTKNINTYG